MNLVRQSNLLNEAETYFWTEHQESVDEYPAGSDEPAVLTLDEGGTIQDHSRFCTMLFGYQHIDLVMQHVSILIPRLLGVDLIQKGRFNPMINFLCRCEQIFRAQRLRGDTFPCRLSFIRLEYDGRPILRLIVHPAGNTW